MAVDRRCEFCGSKNLTIESEDNYSLGKGALGVALFGTGGAVMGVNGKTDKIYKCNDCGHISKTHMDDSLELYISVALISPNKYKSVLDEARTKYKNIETPVSQTTFNDEKLKNEYNEDSSKFDKLELYKKKLNTNKYRAYIYPMIVEKIRENSCYTKKDALDLIKTEVKKEYTDIILDSNLTGKLAISIYSDNESKIRDDYFVETIKFPKERFIDKNIILAESTKEELELVNLDRKYADKILGIIDKILVDKNNLNIKFSDLINMVNSELEIETTEKDKIDSIIIYEILKLCRQLLSHEVIMEANINNNLLDSVIISYTSIEEIKAKTEEKRKKESEEYRKEQEKLEKEKFDIQNKSSYDEIIRILKEASSVLLLSQIQEKSEILSKQNYFQYRNCLDRLVEKGEIKKIVESQKLYFCLPILSDNQAREIIKNNNSR